MSSFAKGKLIFTINSLNNLYGIDERELLLNCLTSLNNNVYNITGFKVPDLGQEMYQRDLQELRNTLFKGYIRKIKNTQHDLTDLILNDIFKVYEPRLTETYNMFISGTFYGGENGDNDLSAVSKATRTPPSLVEIREAKFFIIKNNIMAKKPSNVSNVSSASRTSATSIPENLVDKRIIDLDNMGLLEPSTDVYSVIINDTDKQKLFNKLKQEFPKDVNIPKDINVADIRKKLLNNILSIDDEKFQKVIKNDINKLIEIMNLYVKCISGDKGLEKINTYVNKLSKKNFPDWAYNYNMISYLLNIILDYLLIKPSYVINNIVEYMLMNFYMFNDEVFNQ